MSVVAWDGKTLAADNMAVNAGHKYACTKIFKRKNTDLDVILAITGTICIAREMVDWYLAGAKRKDWPQMQSTPEWCRLIVVDSDGSCWEFTQSPLPVKIEQKHFAWGSGRDYALGALKMGANSEMAVEVANELSDTCGFGVTAFKWES